MRRSEKLRHEARDVATRRGHDLGRFAYTGWHDGWEASCRRCGQSQGVYPGWSYEIVGEPVAVNCTGHRDDPRALTRDDLLGI